MEILRGISWKTMSCKQGSLLYVCLLALLILSPAMAGAQASLGVERIFLDISPQQVVGRTLIAPSNIFIYEVGDSLRIDYSLFINPIRLSATNGGMLPSFLGDPNWCDSGIVDLSAINVRYIGPTGVNSVVAENDSGVVSNFAEVSFNGYDILKVFDFKGDTLTHLFSGYPVTARVAVTNGGTLRADSNPSLRTSFLSGGGSVRVFFSPDDSGAVDTIPVSINTVGLAAGIDTLIVDLESSYRINGILYTTQFRDSIPIEIKPLASVELQNGAYTPDSVYAGANFPFGFAINAPGFEGPIDSSHLKVELLYGPGDAQSTTLCDLPVTQSNFVANVIQYANVPAQISLAAGLLPGWYHLRTNYSLISGASVFSVTDFVSDSLYILPFTSPQYVPETFKPVTAAAGGLTAFSFDLTVTDVDSLLVDSTPGRASLTISDVNTSFTSTAPLVVPGRVLRPGRNTVTSDPIFIPANELGRDLTVSATLHYRESGSGSFLPFTTDCDSQLIRVQPLPIAQVVLTRSVAPNAPNVNVNQPFLIRTRVANVSNSPLDSVMLRMTCDGVNIATQFDTIPLISVGDTATVDFPVISNTPATDVVFRIDIVSTHHGQAVPFDNIATVRIESPADLRLVNELKLTVGSQNYVETGASFILTVSMIKFGQSGVTEGTYHLSTQGLDLGFPDPGTGRDTLGDIMADQQIDFEMTAPDFDTTFTLTFTLTSKPTDINTGSTARFTGDTTFSYTINVASTFAAMFVSPVQSPPVPVFKNVPSEFFQLRFDNLAISSVNLLCLDSIRLRVTDIKGSAVDVTDVFDTSSVGFFLDDTELTSVLAQADTLTLIFDEFQVPAGESRMLALRSNILADIGSAFSLILDTSGVMARYLDGPAQGEKAPVTAPPNGGSILKRSFAVAGPTLEQSFIVEDNPWHPGNGNARFAYTLVEESVLEFRIFTLGGELVLNRRIEVSSPLASPGPHILEWDGRNGRGVMVHDGVYIVCLQVLRTGEEARLKVAVLK